MKEKSVRLNMAMRDDFVDKVTEDAVGEYPPTINFSNKYANHAFETYYAPLMAVFEQLPSWALTSTQHVAVELAIASPIQYQYSGRSSGRSKFTQLIFDIKRTVMLPSSCVPSSDFYKDKGYDTSLSIAGNIPLVQASDPLYAWYQDLRTQQDDWERKRNEIRKQTRKLIEPLNTTAQLYAAWPGAKKYKECFPYKERQVASTEVSSTEMDVAMRIGKAAVTNIVEEN